jgi:iron complex outermembrane receptor protein
LDNQRIAERRFDRTQVPQGYETLKLYSVGFLVNGGTPISKNIELFWTGISNYRYPTHLTAFRFPKNEEQVNMEIFPDGFLAKTYSPVWDLSFKAGAKGKTRNNWKWNFNSSYGKNKITTETHNNNNASQQYLLGANAPTDFKCGETAYSQFLNNINFIKSLKALNSRLKSINASLGGEWRLENFQLIAGEEASWKNYDSTERKQGGVQGNVGISDSNVVNVSRHVTAIYAAIETEINDHLLIDKAVRFEYYSGFGGNLAGKLAARYKFSDKFLLRGSVSNSFRAPPLQQAYYSSTINNWLDSNGVRIPAVVGIFRNDHDVISRGFGVPKLKPEKAINISGGFTSYISSHLSLTVDAYWIQIKDRIVFSGRFNKTKNPDVARILQPYPDIGVVQFTCNAVNTRTIGGDMVLNSRWNLFKGQFGFTLAANFNQTRIFGIVQSAANLTSDSVNTNTLFDRGEIGRLENLQPSSKIILTTFYNRGNWNLTMINRRFGSTEYIHETDSNRDEFFSAKIVTDLNVKFSPKTWYSLTIGCNNIFNITPDGVKNYANTNDGRATYGSQYLPFSPNGGYYFLSMAFKW